MPELYGHTRARIAARHALITPDNHVQGSVPGVLGAKAVVLVSPAMGAGFAQVLLTFESGGSASAQAGDLETFGFVMNGKVGARVGEKGQRLAEGGYFFSPAGHAWKLESPAAGTQVTLFQKKYAPLAGAAAPAPVLGDASRVEGGLSRRPLGQSPGAAARRARLRHGGQRFLLRPRRAPSLRRSPHHGARPAHAGGRGSLPA